MTHHAKITGLLGAALLTASAACTSDPGEPWGWVEGELRLEAPSTLEPLSLEEIDLELSQLRLIGASDTPAAEGEGDDGHAHDTPEAHEEEDKATAEMALANFASLPALTGLATDTPVELGEAAVMVEGDVEEVELELDAARITGHLARGEETWPVVILLGPTTLHAATDAHFGPDEAEHQRLSLTLELPADWWRGVDLDGLEPGSDGTLELSDTSNTAAFDTLAERWARAHLEADIVAGDDDDDHAH